ncbi:hypothetical protein HMPREF9993_09835 [Staphylococcus epidermidis NIHLM087]|nr:hypothetical protein HMPREF9995_09505 [Staphylococcus epidermidis NIHLM095]EJD77928.1 hypothetical protein HMPREF9993_09835 [Staphylococcus epidermidis NIHLM087]
MQRHEKDKKALNMHTKIIVIIGLVQLNQTYQK